MSIQRLIVPAEWKAADDGDPGSLEGYLSTFGNVDLQGDVIEQGAFAKTINKVNWKGIPLLADHRASVRDVLGTIVQASEDSHGLRIKAKFAADPDAQAIRQKLLDGHLKAMSIGYEPKEWGIREEEDGRRVRVLKEVKLWEGSVVVFPANPEAIVDRVKSAVRSTVDTAIAAAVASGQDGAAVKAALESYFTGMPALPDEVKAAIASHSTPTSTGAWDGPANEARLRTDGDAAYYRRAYAWVNPEADPATKAAYKFIHHEVADDGAIGAANVRACQAGMAVLNGGRGGANIPDADRAGVHAHLARHMRDAGVDVPELASLADDATQTQDHGPDSARLKMLRADALLAGEDPDDVIDPVVLAGVEARVEGLDEWIKTSSRRLELREQMDELKGQLDQFRNDE